MIKFKISLLCRYTRAHKKTCTYSRM